MSVARELRALLVNDTSLSGHHGSALVVSQLVALAAEAGIAVDHGWGWDEADAALEEAGNRFQLVLVNGEGSMHHDSRAARRIATLAESLAARDLPAYLVNASEEANSEAVLEGLRAFRLRFVRDAQSQASLGRAGLASRVVHDLTLTWSAAPRAGGKGDLLVTDASDPGKTARLFRLARGWSGARMITFRTRPPRPVRASRSRRRAFEVKRLVSSLAPRSQWSLRYGGAFASREEIGGVMANSASGIVCGRYHAVCFALRMLLPFIAVEGNIGKIGALLSDIGIGSRLRRLEDLEAAGAAPAVAPFSTAEEKRIVDFLAATEADARTMFQTIAADASRSPVAAPAIRAQG